MRAKKAPDLLLPPQANLRRGYEDWVSFLCLGGNGNKGCPPKPSVHINNPLPLQFSLCFPGRRIFHFPPHPNPYHLSLWSCFTPTFPIPPPAKLLPLLLPSFQPNISFSPHLPAMGQSPPAPSLPKLEDDASGHENNNDGDGNCDIELGVHT